MQGTLFLDEVGDLSPAAQAKLLRFLEEGTFYRIGGTKKIHVQTRVVSATNRNLEAMMALYLVPHMQGRAEGWEFYFRRNNAWQCQPYTGGEDVGGE